MSFIYATFFPPGIRLVDPRGFKCSETKQKDGPLHSLWLGFQKKLDIFNALLGCHSDDVVQGVHLAQHLHNLFDEVPVGAHGLYVTRRNNVRYYHVTRTLTLQQM